MNPLEEEEFAFYKMVEDFEYWLERYGVDCLLSRLKLQNYNKVREHFINVD